MKKTLLIILLVLGFTGEGVCGSSLFDDGNELLTAMKKQKIMTERLSSMVGGGLTREGYDWLEEKDRKEEVARKDRISRFWALKKQYQSGEVVYSRKELEEEMKEAVYEGGRRIFSDAEVERACDHMDRAVKNAQAPSPEELMRQMEEWQKNLREMEENKAGFSILQMQQPHINE